MLNVLLVEDDFDLAETVIDYLAIESISCDYASNGVAGQTLLADNTYDVVLLDLNLPRLDGLTLCRQLRSQGNDTPVLMLTARDRLDDKVDGFEAGTDDYLVLIHKEDTWFGKPKSVVFAMSLELGNEMYYVVHLPSPHETSPLIGDKGKENQRMLLGISLLTALGISVLIWVFLKQVERPVKSLEQWAHGLDAELLKTPAPDFIYPELNELARLIQKSLSSVQESLDREHKFLRHASHELCSPISVIISNVELLKKLNESPIDMTGADPYSIARQTRQKNKIIDRIDRAGLTMKHLTQTLLWLGQDEQVQLPVSQMDLEQLVLELAEEAGYLLRDKGVQVVLDTRPSVITLSQVPARIVIGNLIRNAFQHTWRGSVQIIQNETCVKIINEIPGEDNTNRDLGFGLGLQLTRQLCDRLGWSYTCREEDGLHRAGIVFCETDLPDGWPLRTTDEMK